MLAWPGTWYVDWRRVFFVRLHKIVFIFLYLRDHYRLSRAIDRAVRGGVFDKSLPRCFHRLNKTKHLRPYLASSFSFRQRLLAYLSFYAIFSNFCFGERDQCFRIKGTLWESHDKGSVLSLTVEQAVDCLMEGELTLAFLMDAVILYRVTLSIFEGSCIGIACPRLVFVGGLQGAPNSRELQRVAARLNGEVAPLDMLFIAVRALAQVFDASQIVGVRNSDQISYAYAGDRIFFDYDAFWEGLSGRSTPVGYLLEIDPPEKPLLEIGASHRSRAKRKRKLKQNIHAMILEKAGQLFSWSAATLASHASPEASDVTMLAAGADLAKFGIDQTTSEDLVSPALA